MQGYPTVVTRGGRWTGAGWSGAGGVGRKGRRMEKITELLVKDCHSQWQASTMPAPHQRQASSTPAREARRVKRQGAGIDMARDRCKPQYNARGNVGEGGILTQGSPF